MDDAPLAADLTTKEFNRGFRGWARMKSKQILLALRRGVAEGMQDQEIAFAFLGASAPRRENVFVFYPRSSASSAVQFGFSDSARNRPRSVVTVRMDHLAMSDLDSR